MKKFKVIYDDGYYGDYFEVKGTVEQCKEQIKNQCISMSISKSQIIEVREEK